MGKELGTKMNKCPIIEKIYASLKQGCWITKMIIFKFDLWKWHKTIFPLRYIDMVRGINYHRIEILHQHHLFSWDAFVVVNGFIILIGWLFYCLYLMVRVNEVYMVLITCHVICITNSGLVNSILIDIFLLKVSTNIDYWYCIICHDNHISWESWYLIYLPLGIIPMHTISYKW